MDLQQEWQNINAEINAAHHTDVLPVNLNSSTGLLQSILFKLNWKLRWIRIIDLPVLLGALFTTGDLRITLIIIFCCFDFFRALSWMQYKKVKTSVDYASSTKKVLEDNVKAIQNFLKIENIWGYLFLPLSAPAGFLVYKLFVSDNFTAVVNQPYFFYKLVFCALLGIPGILMANKANRSLFSAHLKDLKQKIDQLKD